MTQVVNTFMDILTQDKDVNGKTSPETLYQQLLDLDNGDGEEIMEFLEANPFILGEDLVDKHTVYDYLYDYVVYHKCHPLHESKWYDYLIESTRYLDGLGTKGDIIKSDKRYIYTLQHNSQNYLELFAVLIETYFEVGDFNFLLHSVAARGELAKLRILCDNFDGIEKHTELIEVALRFGRLNILRFLLYDLEMSSQPLGHVLEFPNYRDNPRMIYYHQDIGKNFENYCDIVGSCQDYIKSLECILGLCTSDITVRTLEIWCALSREKLGRSYLWDRIPNEVLVMLKDQLTEPLPLNHDFGDFNNIIFGEWSNHSSLINQYISLQEKHQALQERYELLSYKYKTLVADHYYKQRKEELQAIPRRRCETE